LLKDFEKKIIIKIGGDDRREDFRRGEKVEEV
jgi:hypothetical protein